MHVFRTLISGLRALLRRDRAECEMSEELEAYLDAAVNEKMRAGMSREDALRAARVEIGSMEAVKEAIRSVGWEASVKSVWQDVRYGLRQLRRNPGFTAVAIITLALGIGANTAIFSLIDTVMLRSMPVRDPSQLVLFRWEARHAPSDSNYSGFGDCTDIRTAASASGCSFSLAFFEKMQSRSNLFSGVSAFAGPLQFDLISNGPPTTGRGELVSGSYFSTLGVRAVIGRVIGPEDDTPKAPPVLVLSYAYWQRAFGGAPSAVGRTVVLNKIPFTIVGVVSATFTRLSPGKTQDFWLPIAMESRLNNRWLGKSIQSVRTWWLVVLGRLKPAISRTQAQAAASLMFRNEVLHAAGKPMFKPRDQPAVRIVPAQQGLTGRRGHFSQSLYILMFAVGIILLIACANIAGLLLARGTARQKEMAVRLAVGAGRGRIVRQLLTESVLLSIFGGLLGVLFAFWGVDALTALLWGQAVHRISFVVAPDERVLIFTISLSLVTGIIFGLAPALRSTHIDLTPALKENASTVPASASQSGRRFHLGDSLVVAQLALSVLLLAGAGLLVRTLVNLRDVNPGFDTQDLLLFAIDPTSLGYKDAQTRNLYRELQAGLATLPGVTSVSYSSHAVLVGGTHTTNVYIESHLGQPEVEVVSPGPGFLRTLRIPLLEGRSFTPSDFQQADEAAATEKAEEKTANSTSPQQSSTPRKSVGPPMPVLVNRMFVRKFFPHQNPLGKRLGNDKSNPRAWEIAGVVGDVKLTNLRYHIHPTVYVPLTGGSADFVLRSADDPASLIPTVRKLARQIASGLPISNVSTQTQNIDDLLSQERFIARVSSFFALLALLLASLGLYGLLSYEVSRRTREIGIRMALGAQKADVVRLVLVQGFKLAIAGLTLGVIGAFALTRLLSSVLYGLKAIDPLTFAGAAATLTVVALLACYIPARRAASIDPMEALRYE
jgi:predicted permease